MQTESFTLLLNQNLQDLTNLLEGVPHPVLEAAVLPAQANDPAQTVKQACCLLTAWDGEMLRRLHYITGQRLEPVNPVNTVDWSAWASQQVSVKQVMTMRGTLVDLVGTRQRLIAQVVELADYQFERWFPTIPQAAVLAYDHYLPLIATWRQQWSPPEPEPVGGGWIQNFKLWWQTRR